MVTLLKRAITFLILSVLIAYVADDVLARTRGDKALKTVQVRPYYAVPLKNGKTELMMLPTEDRTCVIALFPHFGYSPCWRIDGQREKRIDL
jgi:L-lysine 2,3-aminomutase